MAQALRLLGFIAFASLISLGLYSQGIVYLCLFLFTIYLVVRNRAIRSYIYRLRFYTQHSFSKKNKSRKSAKIMRKAKRLGLTVYSNDAEKIESDEPTTTPKLSLINGKRTR